MNFFLAVCLIFFLAGCEGANVPDTGFCSENAHHYLTESAFSEYKLYPIADLTGTIFKVKIIFNDVEEIEDRSVVLFVYPDYRDNARFSTIADSSLPVLHVISGEGMDCDEDKNLVISTMYGDFTVIFKNFADAIAFANEIDSYFAQ